eukprot:gene8800-34626_t
MFSFSLLCLLSTGKVVDFDAAGAVSGEDGDTAVAFNNTALMNKLFDSLDAGDTLYVPNKTYAMMGGIVGNNLENVTFRVDGTLQLSNDTKYWPTGGKDGKMPITSIILTNSTGLTITSGGTGTLDGQGNKWWGIPGVGYLARGKNRPPIMHVINATGFILEHLLFLNSPRFHFMSQGLRDATIRYCDVSARRTTKAFNTDGFDVSGKNIHIHDCTVWNQDDTFAVKANGEDTENVLIERVQASGVGLTIGSISDHGKVRNVTFRDVLMHHTSKGVYIKFRALKGPGSITDVTYENVYIDKPDSWPIWIGPAQQDIKEGAG